MKPLPRKKKGYTQKNIYTKRKKQQKNKKKQHDNNRHTQ